MIWQMLQEQGYVSAATIQEKMSKTFNQAQQMLNQFYIECDEPGLLTYFSCVEPQMLIKGDYVYRGVQRTCRTKIVSEDEVESWGDFQGCYSLNVFSIQTVRPTDLQNAEEEQHTKAYQHMEDIEMKAESDLLKKRTHGFA